MIYFFHGPDTYRKEKEIRSLVNASKEKYPSRYLEYFDFKSDDFSLRLGEFSKDRSLFTQIKIGVVKYFDFNKKKKEEDSDEPEEDEDNSINEAVIKIFKEIIPNKEVILIISSSGKLPEYFEFLLESNVDIRSNSFEFLTGEVLKRFIKDEIEKQGIVIKEEIINKIIDEYKDPQNIITEVKRLSLLNKESASNLLDDLKKEEIVLRALLNRLDGANRKDKLLLLSMILDGKIENNVKIFNMLAYSGSNQEKIRAFSEYDFLIKSGKLDYDEALLDFVLRD